MFKKIISIFLLLFSFSSFSFIPDASQVLRRVFEGRKRSPRAVVVLKHQIRIPPSFELIEEIAEDQGQFLLQLRTNQFSISAKVTALGYQFPGGDKIKTRSNAFLSFWVLSQAERFGEILLKEDFLTKAELQTFKPEVPVAPFWNLRDYYLRQDNLFLTRTSRGIGVAVQLEKESSDIGRRLVFSSNLSQLWSIEWTDRDTKDKWTFDTTYLSFPLGKYPKNAYFSRNGESWFDTAMVSRKELSEASFLDWKKKWQEKYQQENSEALSKIQTFISFR